MYVTKEMDYGLRALIVIASSEKALSMKEISENYRIPHNFISLVLPKLRRSGLVQSEKIEKKEVYRLAKPAREITLLTVSEAINGPLDLIVMNGTNRDEVNGFESMMNVWQGLKVQVESFLLGITLESLLMTRPRARA